MKIIKGGEKNEKYESSVAFTIRGWLTDWLFYSWKGWFIYKSNRD